MSQTHRLSHMIHLLVASTCVLMGIAVTSTAASALEIPASGAFSGTTARGPGSRLVRAAVPGGTPAWQIALIFTALVLASAAIIVVAYQARVAHRTQLPAA